MVRQRHCFAELGFLSFFDTTVFRKRSTSLVRVNICIFMSRISCAFWDGLSCKEMGGDGDGAVVEVWAVAAKAKRVIER